MPLQLPGQVHKLCIHRRHLLPKFRDRHGRAHAGHDVFALRVGQILGEDVRLSRGRIARETHACAAGLAAIAEDHCLHCNCSSHGVCDLVQLPVEDGAVALPRAEHGLDRQV